MSLKAKLLKEINRRKLDLEFDDIDEVVFMLERLVLEVRRTEEQIINEYLQFLIDNWEE